jgi:hypothetical protein
MEPKPHAIKVNGGMPAREQTVDRLRKRDELGRWQLRSLQRRLT